MCREMFLMQNSMGSMRLFYSAGEAVEAENAMAFNCKYQHMDSVKSFADLLYSLLCTCGVGIGVSSEHVNKLPNLPTNLSFSTETIMVEDDRQGWATALHTFITGLYAGVSRKFNTEKVREYGAPLKTSGGFASGPEPLNELRDFIEEIFMVRVSDKLLKLKPIDVHDIGCKIADCAIQGGVRRAALISLFDEDDEEMLYAKTKENLLKNPHRYNSNNTMIYKGNKNQLKKIFELIKINGEPGILFYYNMMKRMKRLGRVSENGFGANPCFEIIMLSNAFCNLVEAVLRAGGNLHDDMLKVRYATIMALMQATLTNYNFITEDAKKNQENDPIIGVSLTGLCDCERYYGEGFESRLDVLKQVVEKTVDEFWQEVGLKCRPKASTCVKPSGTVSQLVDCSSGIHPRHAKYYVRRILVEDSKKICGKLIKIGVPFTQMGNCKLFEFVFKAPETSLTIDECDIKRQLNYVAKVMKHWCDHNVSCTLYVRDNEWETLYTALENEDHEFIGLSFLPESIATDTSGFAYLPFEKITKEEYETRSKTLLNVSWEELMTEDDDTAVVSREFACSGGSCSIS